VRAILGALALALGAALPAPAPGPRQATPAVAADTVAADTIAADTAAARRRRVYLVTMGIGDQVWERFGHNAIWIHDPASGTDRVYNWGVFDFAQPGFVRRFLTGDTRYWLAVEDAREMVSRYASLNRTVWAQELDLSPAQARALREFVEWNARPENRYYRYDYYRDNCSTRARDALDRVLDGQIRRATDSTRAGESYHWHTARLLGRDPAVYTGITLALGQPAEPALTAWEEMFVPMEMQRSLRDLRVRDERGVERRLVRAERVLFEATREGEPERPPRAAPLFLLAGAALAALVLVLGGASARGRRGARLAWVAIVEGWCIVAGVAGVLLFLVYVTRHVYMWHNENLFQLAPLSLVLALLLPRALRRGGARAPAALAWTIAVVAAAGALLKALPGLDQGNWEIIAFALPVHLAVAWTLGQLSGAAQRRAAATGMISSRRVA
jgi:hypothetical protein